MEEKMPVIVVEGKTDIDRLSRMFNAIYIQTNGSDVPRETINYIKELSKSRKIIILTDPDYPGLQIRNKLSKEIPNAYHAYVDRNKSSNGKKLGVAECEEEEIKRALSSLVQYDYQEDTSDFDSVFMYNYGLSGKNSSLLRKKVFDHFNLGFGSAKVLAKRLSQANIKKEEVIKYLKDLNNEDCK